MVLDKFRLDGRVAVVTGGGKGIGLAIANALADAGAQTVIAEVDHDLGERAARRLGGRAEFVALDVSDARAVRAAADEVIATHGKVDILVNNAGICLNAGALDTTDEIWRRQMAVNLDGVFYCSREFGRRMMERRSGCIVNLSSIAGVIDVRPQHHIAYSASKAAVTQMSRVLAAEWADHNVRVNAIGPGYVATDMPLAAGPELVNTWMSQVPIGRMIDPDEIASAVLFLVSDAASAITGHLLMADGGYTVW